MEIGALGAKVLKGHSRTLAQPSVSGRDGVSQA